jgi:ABC-type amino acid transport substrate-binding protein
MKQVWLLLLSALLLTVGLFTYLQRRVDPPIESIVASSLQSLREQNRLSAFAARFVTVVTSSKARFGLSAEKTLIIPALVRYEVDLAKLSASDLKWDAAAKVLTITLPPVEISGPEFDLAQTREYESGRILLTLTDVERRLDAQNRAKAKADIVTQAQAAPMMKLAQDASIRAITTNFALPLAAAGVEAKVVAGF